MMSSVDVADFWKEAGYAREKYIERPLTDELVASVEQELGFKLPGSYVALMRSQNGGIPKRTCFPTETPTSWAEDHVAIAGFLGIGRTKPHSLLGKVGSRFMQEEWGYPRFGICICDCPSAGHDMIMLDYRECGPQGEPTVVHVDQECGYKVTFLAKTFDSFISGLVHESECDESAELAEVLKNIDKGSFSTAMTELLRTAPSPAAAETTLRGLLRAIAVEKGYLSLHADPMSHLVYDFLFDLYSRARRVPSSDTFLKAYKELIAFGDGEITTAGYAPQFVANWMKARLATGAIFERDGTLTLRALDREAMMERLAGLGN